MKYLCLGYHEERAWRSMSEADRAELLADTATYDETLRGGGHVVDARMLGESPQSTTLRFRNGKVLVTDGPFAETKEFLGGFIVLEANDLTHAIDLMSRVPCMRVGGRVEIWPIDETAAGGSAAAAGAVHRPQTLHGAHT